MWFLGRVTNNTKPLTVRGSQFSESEITSLSPTPGTAMVGLRLPCITSAEH